MHDLLISAINLECTMSTYIRMLLQGAVDSGLVRPQLKTSRMTRGNLEIMHDTSCLVVWRYRCSWATLWQEGDEEVRKRRIFLWIKDVVRYDKDVEREGDRQTDISELLPEPSIDFSFKCRLTDEKMEEWHVNSVLEGLEGGKYSTHTLLDTITTHTLHYTCRQMWGGSELASSYIEVISLKYSARSKKPQNGFVCFMETTCKPIMIVLRLAASYPHRSGTDGVQNCLNFKYCDYNGIKSDFFSHWSTKK